MSLRIDSRSSRKQIRRNMFYTSTSNQRDATTEALNHLSCMWLPPEKVIVAPSHLDRSWMGKVHVGNFAVIIAHYSFNIKL